ncbi:hypothetical protein [Nonomuraea sp. NPDC050691]|uniref:hypothetical protein n=1 Tax=Nonomuraea sp. NPDC050691 TaxID=3155661 RepID=UPI0033F59B27
MAARVTHGLAVRDPAATAAQWAEADRYDPGAVDADGRWRLRFRAYAIRSDKGRTIVDAGIGPADGPAVSWAPVPGVLPESLAAAGIGPAQVDTAVREIWNGIRR